jgi:hypothetical protein
MLPCTNSSEVLLIVNMRKSNRIICSSTQVLLSLKVEKETFIINRLLCYESIYLDLALLDNFNDKSYMIDWFYWMYIKCHLYSIVISYEYILGIKICHIVTPSFGIFHFFVRWPAHYEIIYASNENVDIRLSEYSYLSYFTPLGTPDIEKDIWFPTFVVYNPLERGVG